MKRKIASIILAFVLILMSFAAFAAEAVYNEKDYQKACATIEKANAKIVSLVEHAQKTKKNDVAQLLKQVDQVIEQTTKKVEKLGFEVACTYDTYIVDGQVVIIDPLYVINPRPPRPSTDNK